MKFYYLLPFLFIVKSSARLNMPQPDSYSIQSNEIEIFRDQNDFEGEIFSSSLDHSSIERKREPLCEIQSLDLNGIYFISLFGDCDGLVENGQQSQKFFEYDLNEGEDQLELNFLDDSLYGFSLTLSNSIDKLFRFGHSEDTEVTKFLGLIDRRGLDTSVVYSLSPYSRDKAESRVLSNETEALSNMTEFLEVPTRPPSSIKTYEPCTESLTVADNYYYPNPLVHYFVVGMYHLQTFLLRLANEL